MQEIREKLTEIRFLLKLGKTVSHDLRQYIWSELEELEDVSEQYEINTQINDEK